VTAFLIEFQTFVDRHILVNPERNLQAMIVSTVLDPANTRYLPAAIELIRAREELFTQLRARLMSHLSDRLPRGWSICRRLDEQGGYVGLKPPDTVAQGWHFGVATDDGNNKQDSNSFGWFYGIATDGGLSSPEESALVRRGKTLRPYWPGSGDSNEYWPLWCSFGESNDEHDIQEYRLWKSSPTPWVDMATGKMADNILELAKQMSELFATGLPQQTRRTSTKARR
jgi:hypothetical protein